MLKTPWIGRSRRRSPCGERGLKLYVYVYVYVYDLSLPVWGAWIETKAHPQIPMDLVVAPRVGGVD